MQRSAAAHCPVRVPQKPGSTFTPLGFRFFACNAPPSRLLTLRRRANGPHPTHIVVRSDSTNTHPNTPVNPPTRTVFDLSTFVFSDGSRYSLGSIVNDPATYAPHVLLDSDPGASSAQTPGMHSVVNGAVFSLEAVRGQATFYVSGGGTYDLETPDSGESFVIQVSTNESVWATVGAAIEPADLQNDEYTTVEREFTGATGLYFVRLYQVSGSGEEFDDYAIKNFVLDNDP